jgi:hypothetical protein
LDKGISLQATAAAAAKHHCLSERAANGTAKKNLATCYSQAQKAIDSLTAMGTANPSISLRGHT